MIQRHVVPATHSDVARSRNRHSSSNAVKHQVFRVGTLHSGRWVPRASRSAQQSPTAEGTQENGRGANAAEVQCVVPPEMNCVATGMDVQCELPPTDINCVATGMDVQCDVPAQASCDSDINSSGSTTSSSQPPADALQQVLAGALLISPFFFWGTSMVVMKGLMDHTTPLFLGSVRLLPAGLLLVLWAQLKGRPQPTTPTAWAWILAFAVVDGAAFQAFLAEGLQRTTAGLGSVIIDSQPLSVAVLCAVFFGERLAPAALVGLALGVAGLALLELPQEAVDLQMATGVVPDGSGGPDLLHLPAALMSGSVLDSGEFYMLLAAQSMAVGTVMVRFVTRHCDPVMATGWHMALGGAMLLAGAVSQDAQQLQDRLALFTTQDALSMAYVSLLGGAASYGIFFYNASKGNLTALSSLTFLTPVFAAGGGYLALHETLTPLQLTGALITLSAVFLINKKA